MLMKSQTPEIISNNEYADTDHLDQVHQRIHFNIWANVNSNFICILLDTAD